MMNDSQFEVLVVDDDLEVRELMARSIVDRGMFCEAARDGLEALAYVDNFAYDVVTIDLRMPNLHGHALALEVLQRPDPPKVLVVTGVLDSRLARDLLDRGVSDVLFKPVDCDHLAAQVRLLAGERRSSQSNNAEQDVDSALQAAIAFLGESTLAGGYQPTGRAKTSQEARPQPRVARGSIKKVSIGDFQLQLARGKQMLRISDEALQVYKAGERCNPKQLGGEIGKNDVLTDEVVKLANRPFYNPRRDRITSLEQAVTQVGRKRIGQLALASNAQAALSGCASSPLHFGSVWRCSVAAGFAVELLVAQGKHRRISDGLLLCATMQFLGRVMLASLYPNHFEKMLEESLATQQPLDELEDRYFPKSQSEVISHVLGHNFVSPETCQVLSQVQKSYQALSQLEDPLRSRVELVKIAGLLARIIVGEWEDWEQIEVPPGDVMKRLRLQSLVEVIDETTKNINGVNDFEIEQTPTRRSGDRSQEYVGYLRTGDGGCDLLGRIINSIGHHLVPYCEELTFQHVVANCLGVRDSQVLRRDGSLAESTVAIICDGDDTGFYSDCPQVVSMPTSCGALRLAVEGPKQPDA